jgi:threonine-phosphate decarboxylase
MIKGHGDDIYQYGSIQMNFSSNICQQKDLEALKAHLATKLDLIDNYPEPEAWSLERLLAQQEDIPEECVIVTNGATEAIYLVAQAFRYCYDLITPSFSEYADALTMFPPRSEQTSIWLCNPNNPTGDVLSKDDIYTMAQSHNLVIIDQSYEDYTHAPMLSAREAIEMGKVIQLHSLTKAYGVPGLRIGYITASARLTKEIRQFLRPWSVNALAIEAGKYLLTHGSKLKPDLKEARRLAQRLRTMNNISVNESHTNFMLCEIHPHTAAELKDYLAKEHGILIRDASNFEELTPHHFRIAAQTPAENDALVAAIKEFMEK